MGFNAQSFVNQAAIIDGIGGGRDAKTSIYSPIQSFSIKPKPMPVDS